MKTFVLLLLLACHVPGRAEEGCTSKFKDFLNRSSYKVREVKPCKVWVVSDALTIPQEAGLQGMLLIAQEGEMGIIGAVVQVKAKLPLSADLMLKLLRLNNEFEFAKVGIDTDGDLFIRTELRMKTLTEEEFKTSLKNLIEVGSQVYSTLKK
jgi:hypothetical protein